MSLKKTWFSYVLWVVLAGLTGITTYLAGVKVLALHPVVTVLLAVCIIGAFIFVHFLCGKIKQFTVSKWLGRILHIVLFLAVTALFIMLRLPAIMDVSGVVSSQQAVWFYESSKVGRNVLEIAGTTSVLEQVYINVLSGLFLFLGNKIEVLLYMQVVLQSISYLFLICIGWTLQKRVYAWIPALLYAVSPFMYSSIEDVGPANFWMCVVEFVIFIICMLQNAWKNRNITYIAVTVAQIIFGVAVFAIKSNVFWYGNESFTTGGFIKETPELLGIEMLIAVAALLGYCISFWFDKQDHKTLFIIPFVVFCIILTLAAFGEYETCCLFMMLAAINLYFLVTESMRVILTFKPEVVTGSILVDKEDTLVVNKDTSDYDWSEMKEIMQDKVTEEKTEVMEEVKEAEVVKYEESVIDKTAPIENVLPMPKKHTPKVLDYAFEPTDDMMHYDVEIENDDYDY